MVTRLCARDGHLAVAPSTALNRISAEGVSGPCREQRVCWLSGPLGQPGPHHGNGARCKRRNPLLSTFAGAADMRTGSEMDVGAVQPDQFGGPKAGLDSKAEQRRVAPPGPGRPVRSGQQGVDLDLGQVCHQPPFEALRRNGQDALDGGGMFGMAQGGIPEQRPDRGQPGVAGAHAVLSFVLQMVEEGADQRRIEIVDVELARDLAVPL